ncbi:anthrax toxin receptor-like [Ochotona curzoniae]|uniref:anthrax toxin receptor-like n=1 Tax=Ochotona curzoniae TaxID=130825 RepID=UPI001B346718|nr:anthrax toxin receptor-like [Ochotona curzoniae]
MGSHNPCAPGFPLFFLLLLLLPPLFRAGSHPYHRPGWKIFNRLGMSSRFLHHRRGPGGKHWRQSHEQECQGSFDLYIILDKSGSVNNNWIDIYNFVEELVKKFQRPNTRMSFILYSGDGVTLMPLTSDREEIRKGLENLQQVIPAGDTNMQEGLKRANEQIQRMNSGDQKTASMIIAMTDGTLVPEAFELSKNEAAKARQMGATIYTVGVKDYQKDQEGVHGGFPRNPLQLRGSPNSYQATITGQGFHNAKSEDEVICRFHINKNNVVDEKAVSMEENKIICPVPVIENAERYISVEVSLTNGKNFIGNKLNMSTKHCVKKKLKNLHLRDTEHRPKHRILPGTLPVQPSNNNNVTINAPIYLIVLLALLLALCLLWCCWRYCCRRYKEPPPVKESEDHPCPPPPPPPPINTCPTVIVSCCGCGCSNGVECNMNGLCNLIQPACHQVPVMWCRTRNQRRCPKLALVNPRCGPVPCGSRVCLRPSRECFHVAPQPCNPRICLQASQDCIRIPQAPCSPRICLGPSQSLLQCCRLPTRYSSSLSRTLPLLSPIKRKSLCLSRSQPRRPCSK